MMRCVGVVLMASFCVNICIVAKTNLVNGFCLEGARYYDTSYYLVHGEKKSIYDNIYYKNYDLDPITQKFCQTHKAFFDALHGVIGPKYLDVRGNQDRWSFCEVKKDISKINLTSLMVDCNQKVCSHLEGKGSRHPLRSRSTAVVACVDTANVFIAQVGISSRALLCRRGDTPLMLTSLNNEHRFKMGDPHTIKPFSMQRKINAHDTCVVLLTDGISDVLTHDEIAEFVNMSLAEGVSSSFIAQKIVDMAIEKINKKYFTQNKIPHYVRDDMTVVVVPLHKGFQGYVGIFDGTGPIGGDIADHVNNFFSRFFTPY